MTSEIARSPSIGLVSVSEVPVASEMKKLSAELTEPYLGVLKSICDYSHSQNIPFAVIGSLGVALTENSVFIPTRSFTEVGPKREGTPRDIDLLCLGTNEERDRFKQWAKNKNFPVEVNFPEMEKMIGFEDGKIVLLYKALKVNTDCRKIQLFDVELKNSNFSAPVLHPKVHAEMVKIRKLVAVSGHWSRNKFDSRILSLEKAANEESGMFGKADNSLLRGLVKLKSLVLVKYPTEVFERQLKSRYNTFIEMRKVDPTPKEVTI